MSRITATSPQRLATEMLVAAVVFATEHRQGKAPADIALLSFDHPIELVELLDADVYDADTIDRHRAYVIETLHRLLVAAGTGLDVLAKLCDERALDWIPGPGVEE